MKKKWVRVAWENCPECGDEAEIYTESDDPEAFYDEEECRCVACHWPGGFVADEEEGHSYIDWKEERNELDV